MTASKWRHPGLLTLRKNPPEKKPRSGRCQDLEDNSGRAWQEHGGAEIPTMGKPPRISQGRGCRMRAAKGGAHRNGKRRQTQARGAGRRDE